MEKVSMEIEKTTNSKQNPSKQIAINLLALADIKINGSNPWDIQVHNDHFYARVMNEGGLGLGESYMDKWWDCERLDIFFAKILRAKLDGKVKIPFRFILQQILAKFTNFQSKARAKIVAHKHYDLGNDLFAAMLDPRMIYSCGYWQDAHTLEQAQRAKLDLVCRKLNLARGMRLLDIGCGWGGFAKFAAENYGVEVVGVTISQQQYDYAKTICAGLPIDIRLQDYRSIQGIYDRVISIGMFEHVGALNYSTFMQTVNNALHTDGLFLLHTIGANKDGILANEWINKYIFPNGMLPSMSQITKPAEVYFVMEDWHNFGADYDKTLMAWYENFINHWPSLQSRYDERFYRMWTYYLLACAGNFRARTSQLWQIVFSKQGVPGGYRSIR